MSLSSTASTAWAVGARRALVPGGPPRVCDLAGAGGGGCLEKPASSADRTGRLGPGGTPHRCANRALAVGVGYLPRPEVACHGTDQELSPRRSTGIRKAGGRLEGAANTRPRLSSAGSHFVEIEN
jgi:hypothetical protein